MLNILDYRITKYTGPIEMQSFRALHRYRVVDSNEATVGYFMSLDCAAATAAHLNYYSRDREHTVHFDAKLKDNPAIMQGHDGKTVWTPADIAAIDGEHRTRLDHRFRFPFRQ